MEEPGYEPIFRDRMSVSPAVERRLTLCLLGYWERIRGDRAMPTESDINPDGEIAALWDDCFLIHADDIEMEDYNFIFLGDNIRNVLTGGIYENLSDASKSLNVKRLTPEIHKVLLNKAPVINDGETVNDAGQLVKYRQCLLPVGEGDKVLAIFGGMRCKIYA